uniref:sulfiredoxin n=1 Tax=Salix viminalis TaxID=40686 RepID=A0A6N2MLE1_SALVM
MANFVLRLPATSFRSFSISASSNGAVPGTSSCTQNGGPVILELPLDKIRRPLMRTRANDQNKVKELMDSIKEIGLQVPLICWKLGRTSFMSWREKSCRIDVLEVDGVYYGFSGCHRYEAHQRLGLPTIRCKIRRGTKETLRLTFDLLSILNDLHQTLLISNLILLNPFYFAGTTSAESWDAVFSK